jgi:hypothetical protein
MSRSERKGQFSPDSLLEGWVDSFSGRVGQVYGWASWKECGKMRVWNNWRKQIEARLVPCVNYGWCPKPEGMLSMSWDVNF